MNLPISAFPKDNLQYGRNAQIINSITIEDNQLVENTFKQNGVYLRKKIGSKNGHPIHVNPQDCEWLSQTFFRNEKDLYGFALIEKSSSTQLFLIQIKANVDFETFEPLGMNYSSDKNRYYYGPSGKIINENQLELFYDETYRAQLTAKIDSNTLIKETRLKIWRSRIAISENYVFWNGILKKELHPSLKRVTNHFFMDNSSVYYYNGQTLKKLEEIDRKSIIYGNFLTDSGSVKSLICDKYKPMHCYLQKSEINPNYDYKVFQPLFKKLSNQLTNDYWWFRESI